MGVKRNRSAATQARVGVIDIGSNTVRLVVFEGMAPVPIPLFNEKVTCGLGRVMGQTGRLSPKGIELALEALNRFRRLTDAMGLARVDLLATAAVREAEDGQQFADTVSRIFNTEVQVLSGEEEARLSAQGVLCGTPNADGLVGDLGGGSLDFVTLDQGRFGQCDTLPLGHLRLAELSKGNTVKAQKIVRENLAGLPWIDQMQGRDLFVVGGSWRAVARLFIDQTGYPLHVIDNFTITRFRAEGLLALVSRLSPKSLTNIPGVSRRRLETLPFAAAALGELVAAVEPRQLIFCGYGMREGQFLKSLPTDVRKTDPLIAACERFVAQRGRFGIQGQEIFDWMSPLFADEAATESRVRMAASLLADIAWSEHPDYRTEHAFLRVLRLPFAGLSHTDRAQLAITMSHRYGRPDGIREAASIRLLLDEGAERQAQVVGTGLRLGHTLSGGVPGLLPRTRLIREKKKLVLELPSDGALYTSDTVQRRLQSVARSLGLDSEVRSR